MFLLFSFVADYEEQRRTFSMHKHTNILKEMMIVAPDGYILHVHGMNIADGGNNDAKILEFMIKCHPELKNYFEPGDCFILDRGFRDVLNCLHDEGIQTKMPPFLERDEKQFSTEAANSSRQVTMARWVVEAVNGRIKNKYK